MTQPFADVFADRPAAPRLYQAAGAALAADVAAGLLRRADAAGLAPHDLARIRIFTGSRRAARALEAALTQARPAALRPKITPLSDLDATPEALAAGLPPAMPDLQRRLTLARLVMAAGTSHPALSRPHAAVDLAAGLADLLDEFHTQGADLQALETLVPTDHARHWGELLTFLNILREAWPQHCADQGAVDSAARRVGAIDAILDQWAAHPPSYPILFVGGAGGGKCDMRFVEAVAGLPLGAVIAPPTESAMSGAAWRDLALSEASDHFHHEAALLFSHLGLDPQEAPVWGGEAPAALTQRRRLISEALRPAPVTDAWLKAQEATAAQAPEALAEVSLIEAPSPRLEAAAIALTIREALETPGHIIAVATPDRDLTRRVATELARWGIAADDSAGRPLSRTPPAVFARLAADVALDPDAGPETFLALMKHPLCAVAGPGLDPSAPESARRGAHARAAREFERFALRGAPPTPGADGLRARLRHIKDADRRVEIAGWLDGVLAALAPLSGLPNALSLSELAARHKDVAIALAGGPDALWDKPAGVELAAYFDDLTLEGDHLGSISPSAYPDLFGVLAEGRAVRAAFGLHPRVRIWGTLEARLQSADVMILAGLNEGVWPAHLNGDPWLNRPMRRKVGLPPPEAEIGRAAADFVSAASAPRLVLTRALRQGDAPTTPSRWLLRLVNLLHGFAPDSLAQARLRGGAYVRGAIEIDKPSVREPAPRPEPRPPRAARPTQLSATAIETLIRDPYAIYAQRCLGLRPLDPLSSRPDARAFGIIAHKVLEDFVRDYDPAAPAAQHAANLDALILAESEGLAPWPALQALWRARLRRMAARFVPDEAERRRFGSPAVLEVLAKHTFDIFPRDGGPAQPFTLTAQADRIDVTSDGGAALYDYKTGKPPSAKQVKAAYAQQLPIEGAIVRAGQFPGVNTAFIARMAYIRVSGGDEDKEIPVGDGDLTAFCDEAFARLKTLLAQYAAADQPYTPRLRPQWLSYEGDYDHLSRAGEWSGDLS